MRLYLISQDVNDSWNSYNSAIVCAATKKEARAMHPDGYSHLYPGCGMELLYDWCEFKDVKVKFIGVAGKCIKRGVLLSSFNKKKMFLSHT